MTAQNSVDYESFINNLPSSFLISSDKTFATLNVPIEKSENDDREYRLIKLANELEVLLVSDSNTDKASAAMDVHIGQIHDPVKLFIYFFLFFLKNYSFII